MGKPCSKTELFRLVHYIEALASEDLGTESGSIRLKHRPLC